MANGFVLYEGASQYDPTVPIVVIATKNSANRKTGNMWQTWIMLRDVEPHKAIKTGEDTAVCGKCPLRPLVYKSHGLKKPCYVLTFQAPLSVWRAYHRGIYPRITPEQFGALLQGNDNSEGLRLGSWGDPASVLYELWESIGVGNGEFNHTSYTHGYLMPDFNNRYLDISMVSLDKVTPQLPPGLNGRSFRVIDSVDQVLPGEILCPASKEMDYKATCEKCGLCAGLARKAKNIAIVIH